MKIFISWSGEQSQKIAEQLRHWISSVNQHVEPYYTPDDIQKGSRWSSDIAGHLLESNFGILCLTQENLSAPWIMFEAGALSKNIDAARVCPILFSVGQHELVGPLTQFQCVNFDKAGLRRLMTTINQTGDKSLIPKEVLDKSFDIWWPDFERSINEILASPPKNPSPTKSESEIMLEILSNTRAIIRSSEGIVAEHASGEFLEGLVSHWEDVVMSADRTDSVRSNYRYLALFQEFIDSAVRNRIPNDSKCNAMLARVSKLISENDPSHRFQLGEASEMYGSE